MYRKKDRGWMVDLLEASGTFYFLEYNGDIELKLI